MSILFKVSEVARELSLSESTVRLWIRTGKINVVRIGERSVRVTDEELSRLKKGGGNE